MGDEHGSEFFGVRVDVEVQLGKDGEPDIFRADLQVVVLVVGLDGTIDEAIGRGVDGASDVRLPEG